MVDIDDSEDVAGSRYIPQPHISLSQFTYSPLYNYKLLRKVNPLTPTVAIWVQL